MSIRSVVQRLSIQADKTSPSQANYQARHYLVVNLDQKIMGCTTDPKLASSIEKIHQFTKDNNKSLSPEQLKLLQNISLEDTNIVKIEQSKLQSGVKKFCIGFLKIVNYVVDHFKGYTRMKNEMLRDALIGQNEFTKESVPLVKQNTVEGKLDPLNPMGITLIGTQNMDSNEQQHLEGFTNFTDSLATEDKFITISWEAWSRKLQWKFCVLKTISFKAY